MGEVVAVVAQFLLDEIIELAWGVGMALKRCGEVVQVKLRLIGCGEGEFVHLYSSVRQDILRA